MTTSRQISVFLDNKPGRMANILRALEKQKVNITGMTVMDSHEHSVLRIVTDDREKTLDVLKDLSTAHTESEVILVELRNQPGALAHVCETLATEHINIDYCYCSVGSSRNGKTLGIFKVSNVAKAQKILDGASTQTKKRVVGRPPKKRQNFAKG